MSARRGTTQYNDGSRVFVKFAVIVTICPPIVKFYAHVNTVEIISTTPQITFLPT
jgi:hypothetical protein